MTITTLDTYGTRLSFDGTGLHGTAMTTGLRPDAVPAAAVQAAKTQGIRPRRPEPA